MRCVIGWEMWSVLRELLHTLPIWASRHLPLMRAGDGPNWSPAFFFAVDTYPGQGRRVATSVAPRIVKATWWPQEAPLCTLVLFSSVFGVRSSQQVETKCTNCPLVETKWRAVLQRTRRRSGRSRSRPQVGGAGRPRVQCYEKG